MLGADGAHFLDREHAQCGAAENLRDWNVYGWSGMLDAASRNPKRFSCILPICGGGKTVYAKLLVDLPIFFAHAKNDLTVPYEDTLLLVDHLKQAGSTCVLLRTWEKAPGPEDNTWCYGHNVWDEFYNDRKTWQWAFQQQNSFVDMPTAETTLE